MLAGPLRKPALRALAKALHSREGAKALALDDVVVALGTAFRMEKASVHRVIRDGDGWDFEFLARTGFSDEAWAAQEAHMRATSQKWTAFDPLTPEARQRNRALTLRQLPQTAFGPGVKANVTLVWPRLGVASHDQLRMLVCDGPLLLAWIGGFRSEPFAAREAAALESLAPALRQYFRVERLMRETRLLKAGLDAALWGITAPAFVASAYGNVEHANAPGVALLDADRRTARERIRRAVAGSTDSHDTVVSLVCDSSRRMYLVVVRERGAEISARLGEAAARWRLTPRQGEVLARLIAGDANKTIAERLHCTEATVEAHVTQILRKSATNSRAELAATFWTPR